MSKMLLPLVLIALGVAEIILAIMDVKMPIVVAIVLGILFIALGLRSLFGNHKK